MSNAEKVIQNNAMLAVGLDPDVMIWRQQVGTFRSYNDPARIVKVGVSGMSDTLAIVKVKITPDMVGKEIGVAVAPEFKTPTGGQRKNQKDWETCFRNRGGIYRLIRSPEQLVQLIKDVKRGIWS